MNDTQRGDTAYRTLLVFMQYAGIEGTSTLQQENGIADLLTGLMHLCDEQGFDFESLLEVASGNYDIDTSAEREREAFER